MIAERVEKGKTTVMILESFVRENYVVAAQGKIDMNFVKYIL